MGVGQAVKRAVPQPDDTIFVFEGLVAPLGENLFQDGHPLGLTPAGQATFDLGGDVGAEALSRLVERRLGPSILKQLLLI